MDKIFTTFEDLFRRSFGPSLAFIIVLLMGHWIAYHLFDGAVQNKQVELWMQQLCEIKLTSISASAVAIAVLFLVGLSYILSAIQQSVFDNFLLGNFESRLAKLFGKKRINQSLCEMRAKAIDRIKAKPYLRVLEETLGEEKLTDYMLYEIIGGIDQAKTRFYVDEAKSIGIFFVSILIVSIYLFFFYLGCCSMWLWTPIWLVWCVLVYFLGRELVKSRYRSRSLRHYVNFLAMPSSKMNGILMDFEKKSAGS